MAKIYVVRHAESLANVVGIYQGQSYDTDLSALGKRQSEALGQALKGNSIKRILSSPLKRTLQTAKPLSKNLRIKIEKLKLLLETNHGDWEGRKKEKIIKLYPQEWRAWQERPSQMQMPNGEHTSETVERMKRLAELMKNFDKDTAVVTHVNIIQFLVCWLDGRSLDEIWEIEAGSACYFVIDNQGGELKVLQRNQTEHLKGIQSDLSKQAL